MSDHRDETHTHTHTHAQADTDGDVETHRVGYMCNFPAKILAFFCIKDLLFLLIINILMAKPDIHTDHSAE